MEEEAFAVATAASACLDGLFVESGAVGGGNGGRLLKGHQPPEEVSGDATSSYYRCTNTKCQVKKRVERSYEDPSIVITTYEGQHCHYTISYPRPIFASLHLHNAITHHHFDPPLALSSPRVFPPSSQFYHDNHCSDQAIEQTQFHEASLNSTSIDEGLLGDIVPSTLRNR
ncbi:hypothetical protein ZIOFF_054539 [Zingiber officinale]|uniref:WRKY domain-containing protein n=1 Tax=Zingiber officinale TaxID=94328 RepID=A0A8J5KDR9_ZINOF|nr:hypothetical protein ZIOFF_054539 [Zingiber officinale]